MIRIFRIAFASVLLAGSVFAGTAAAEITIPVNDNNTGVFDQPSVALSGATAHVAFIGDNATPGVFRVFYAAVNAGANFGNLQLARDNTVLPVPPVAIDNTGTPPNSPYFDARHPKIARRSATEVVILFQARRTATDDFYRPYIARLAVTANSAALLSVREISGFPAGILSTGDIEDISYNLVLADNTARMAFAIRPAISSAAPFHVYFARVGLDDALVVGTPLLLSSGNDDTVAGSDGFRPIPNLKVDGLARSHVAWAATDAFSNPGAIHYALVKETGGLDNIAIGASRVIAAPRRWAHPNVLVAGTSAIIVIAAHERPGDNTVGTVGRVQLNPDAVPHTGVAATSPAFISLTEASLPSEFDLFRPESFLDSTGRIHLTGYGSNGSTVTYYAITLSSASPFATFARAPTQVETSEVPGGIGDDYTKAAFAYISGKAVVFWSGIVGSNPANRNLDVSTVDTVVDPPPPAEESGCSMVVDPRAGESGRIPGAALLFLPAAALAVRRFSKGCRRKPRRSVAV